MEKKKRLLWEIFVTFFKLGCFSFGGGYAMIPLIECEVVEKKKWMEKEKIVDVFAISESLPGAIALNSSTFVGYSIAGIPGAISALLGNLTPSVVIVLTLTMMISLVSGNPIVDSIFCGIRPAIVGLIAYAGVKIGRTALVNVTTIILMLIAFVLATFLHVAPIPLIIFGAVSGIVIKNIENVVSSKKQGNTNI